MCNPLSADKMKMRAVAYKERGLQQLCQGLQQFKQLCQGLQRFKQLFQHQQHQRQFLSTR